MRPGMRGEEEPKMKKLSYFASGHHSNGANNAIKSANELSAWAALACFVQNGASSVMLLLFFFNFVRFVQSCIIAPLIPEDRSNINFLLLL